VVCHSSLTAHRYQMSAQSEWNKFEADHKMFLLRAEETGEAVGRRGILSTSTMQRCQRSQSGKQHIS